MLNVRMTHRHVEARACFRIQSPASYNKCA
jgi:hypothetical protein